MSALPLRAPSLHNWLIALTVTTLATGKAAAVVSAPNGVHVLCLNTYLRPNYAQLLSGMLDLDYVSGLLVYVEWRHFEPAEGQYQWSIFDTALAAAQARGKVASFGLLVQAKSPDWLLKRCQVFTFTHPHPSVGTVTAPVPWDPVYKAALSRTIRALGARYEGHSALHNMVLNGPSSLFGVETNFPVKELAPEAAVKLDYTHEKFEAGWKESIDVFVDAFKQTRLSLGLHHELSLGERDLAMRLQVVRSIRDYAIHRESEHNGKRLIVRLLGLGTEHPDFFPGPFHETGEATTDYLALVEEVRDRADIAYEVARIWRLSNLGGKQQPLSPTRFQRVLDLGISHHAKWLQIKDFDVWDPRLNQPYAPFASALETAHQRLRGDELPTPRQKPPLFAVYYTWYSTAVGPHGKWSSWGQPTPSLLRPAGCDPDKFVGPDRLRDISSCEYPLIGPYDSDDPEVVRWHLRLAKAAGIDAFLVDWWGPGGWQKAPGLTQDAFEKVVLPIAEEEGFKVCLFDETAQFVKDFAQVKAWAADYLAKYQHSPAYLKIDGQPVYVIYQVPFAPRLTPEQATELHNFVEARVGPVYWIVDKIATGSDPATGAFQAFVVNEEWLALDWVDAFCGYGTFAVQRQIEYRQIAPRFAVFATLANERGHRVLVPVHPGHDNRKLQEKPWVMPRRDGQTLRDFLLAAEDAPADYLLLTSFNEWPETTVVEPARTWADPYQYLRVLAEWKGVAFRPPPVPR